MQEKITFFWSPRPHCTIPSNQTSAGQSWKTIPGIQNIRLNTRPVLFLYRKWDGITLGVGAQNNCFHWSAPLKSSACFRGLVTNSSQYTVQNSELFSLTSYLKVVLTSHGLAAGFRQGLATAGQLAAVDVADLKYEDMNNESSIHLLWAVLNFFQNALTLSPRIIQNSKLAVNPWKRTCSKPLRVLPGPQRWAQLASKTSNRTQYGHEAWQGQWLKTVRNDDLFQSLKWTRFSGAQNPSQYKYRLWDPSFDAQCVGNMVANWLQDWYPSEHSRDRFNTSLACQGNKLGSHDAMI